MAQIKIYGVASRLDPIKARLSDAIHSCVVDALSFPAEKRFHRFIALADEDFVFPADRTDKYTIVEIDMFEGRSTETKKELIRLLFERVCRQCHIAPNDLEIHMTETPRSHWGIRGLPADELPLSYKVRV